MSKDLFSSRTPFEKCYLVENVKHLSFIPGNRTLRTAHVNRIFKAFLDGEWMPPIYVSADGEVLDGQNRLAAFRMLKEKYPQNKTAIRVIIINSDASPLNLAIKFNAGHANWVITDYMKAYLEKGLHGYQQLQDFTKAFPEFEFKAAIQLIKGSHSSRKFNNGLLEISNEEYMEACKKAAALIQIAEKLNNKIVTLFSFSIMSGTRFLIFKRISNVSVIFRFRALRIVRSGNLHIVLCCDNFWFLFVNRHVNRVYSMPTTTRRCD